MKNQTRNLTALSALLLLAAAPTLFGTPVSVTPGHTVTFTPTTSLFLGTELATETLPFSNAFENGSVLEDVYQYNGTLDFYYKVTDNLSSIDSLTRLTVGNFKGFTTSVDYLTGVNVAPDNATRQSSGTSVGFNFFDGIDPGQSSDFVEVMTDATHYGPGTVSVIDSLTTSLIDFGPLAVPEPSTWSMLLGGVGALLLVTRVRRGFLSRH